MTHYSYMEYPQFGIGFVTRTVGQIQKVSNGLITTLTSGIQFSYPGGIAVDSTGNLYFTSGSSILKLANGVVTTFAGTGSPGFSGDNGPATSAQLSNPRGVFVDSTDAIWIIETGNGRIRKVSNGIITTVAVTAAPQAIAVDASGEVFFADDNRIRALIPSGSASGTGQSAQQADRDD